MRAAGCAEAAFVTWVEPENGAAGVFRDALVLARLSAPLDPESLSAETFRVCDPAGRVPSSVELSRDQKVVIWRAERLLDPGVEHRVEADGLRDNRGRLVAPHRSCFFPGPLAFRDLVD